MPPTVTRRSALLDGDYRYRLERDLAPSFDTRDGYVCWIMLNPSDADATIDDPTLRRCMGYTELWGYARLVVVNLYAYRTPYPRLLKRVESPLGPGNDDAIAVAAADAALIVCAWGANDMAVPRARAVEHMLDGLPLWCLGRCDAGEPRHPLYLPVNVPLEPYNDPARALEPA